MQFNSINKSNDELPKNEGHEGHEAFLDIELLVIDLLTNEDKYTIKQQKQCVKKIIDKIISQNYINSINTTQENKINFIEIIFDNVKLYIEYVSFNQFILKLYLKNNINSSLDYIRFFLEKNDICCISITHTSIY